MAKNYVNFLSYNSTGLNEAKIKWIQDLIKTTDSSFIGTQEHLRKNKSTEDLFVQNFAGHKYMEYLLKHLSLSTLMTRF
jgi:hypothetical protein